MLTIFSRFISTLVHWKICFSVNSVFAGERKPPPASKQAVKDLPTIKTVAEQEGCSLLQFQYHNRYHSCNKAQLSSQWEHPILVVPLPNSYWCNKDEVCHNWLRRGGEPTTNIW